MADVSLTYYLNLLNHLAESQELFPCEPSAQAHGFCHVPAMLPACFSGGAVWKAVPDCSRGEAQDIKYLSRAKTSPCASAALGWKPRILLRALVFGHFFS